MARRPEPQDAFPYARQATDVMGHLETLGLVLRNTVVIYLLLVVTLRVFGRRVMGQLNVLDLVIIIVMGSAVETAMINGDTSLAAGLVCAATLLATDRALSASLFRSRRWRHLVNGGPVLLIHDGKFIQEHLKRAGLTEEDVLEALRERELSEIKDIRFAVLEPDGEIHAIPFHPPEAPSGAESQQHS